MMGKMRQHRLYILMFSLNLAVLIGVIYLLKRPEPRTLAVFTPAQRQIVPVLEIQVHVTGAVLRPGVYPLPVGARLSDAIEAAGGARPDADLGRLNLASNLGDGAAVTIPSLGPTARPDITPPPALTVPPAVPTAAKIDINKASVDLLDTLPGIGPVLAQRVVDYRLAHGDFKKIDDLKDVSGIGDTLFDGFKDLITVE